MYKWLLRGVADEVRQGMASEFARVAIVSEGSRSVHRVINRTLVSSYDV